MRSTRDIESRGSLTVPVEVDSIPVQDPALTAKAKGHSYLFSTPFTPQQLASTYDWEHATSSKDKKAPTQILTVKNTGTDQFEYFPILRKFNYSQEILAAPHKEDTFTPNQYSVATLVLLP